MFRLANHYWCARVCLPVCQPEYWVFQASPRGSVASQHSAEYEGFVRLNVSGRLLFTSLQLFGSSRLTHTTHIYAHAQAAAFVCCCCLLIPPAAGSTAHQHYTALLTPALGAVLICCSQTPPFAHMCVCATRMLNNVSVVCMAYANVGDAHPCLY